MGRFDLTVNVIALLKRNLWAIKPHTKELLAINGIKTSGQEASVRTVPGPNKTPLWALL